MLLKGIAVFHIPITVAIFGLPLEFTFIMLILFNRGGGGGGGGGIAFYKNGVGGIILILNSSELGTATYLL